MEDYVVIDHCLMVKLPAEIDHHKACYISEKADDLLLSEEVDAICFDFENTEFMDSSGIGIIMGRYRKLSCFGGKVYLIHAGKQIRKMLEMSGIEKVVEIR